MATLTTTLTPEGYKTLLSSGLENNIVYYKIDDNFHNYLVSAPEILVPNINGSHSQITTSQCAFANYTGVFATKPTQQEVQNVISKVQYSFVNEDCAYGNFNQPNITLNINIFSWLQQLSTATYSFNMNQSLVLDLWDYVTATIQTLNLTTKNYDSTDYLTNLTLNYKPKTDFDKLNFGKVSPRVVTIEEGNVKRMVDNSTVRNGSPFLISFSSYSIYGMTVNGAAGRFSLVPNRWGYWVNDSTFISVSELEDSDLAGYTSIYPSAIVGNYTYYLPTNTVYPTESGLIGYALNMVNVDGSGQKMLTGLINQATLFMKTYGIYNSTNNTYVLPINLEVMPIDSRINNITNKYGGNVTLNIIYDINNTSSNPVELVV